MRQIDHLVIAAKTLEQGRQWLENMLGTQMQAGGKHPQFGTHNALLSLGNIYLEVIAVDPEAPINSNSNTQPKRPRWFGLDTASMQTRLSSGPKLIHWVMRGKGLAQHPQGLQLERGEKKWWLTVPADGSLPQAGLAPSQIEWLTPPPPMSLPDSGLRLSRLELCTPQPAPLQRYAGEWQGNAAQGSIKVLLKQAERPRLRAAISKGSRSIWLEG